MATSKASVATATVPNDLEPYWMPFTANRAFKARPRLVVRAKDMHYFTAEGRKLIDGSAGLWCTNAGHNRDPSVAAIQRQAAELDYAPAFQFSHPKAFELASRVASLAPGDLDHVFFCNSGSEAVDTALKIALAFHNVRGNAARVRLIGRERGYHGVGFGGIAVGGIVGNRKMFGALIAGVDHLPTTYNRAEQAFTVGEPEWGGHLAEALEGLVALHDATTIAAVIVEPVAASTGVLPPPKGYLQRLRAICDKHGILLIFDEVITGFGLCLRRRALWRHPRHDHLRQGRHLGQRADGRRAGAKRNLRRLHAWPRARHRIVPRLHLLGASARLRGWPRHPRSLS
jgi:beta-alanine--pyruvate transaminase